MGVLSLTTLLGTRTRVHTVSFPARRARLRRSAGHTTNCLFISNKSCSFHRANINIKLIILLHLCGHTDEDPCLSSPCQFGGTCFTTGAEYTCECREERRGDHCECK